MTREPTKMTPELHDYLIEFGTRRDDTTRAIEEATGEMSMAEMQSSPDQVGLMTLLVKAIGARRALEVGTFTGYGAIAIARGLPEDGELICCELSEEYAALAARNIEAAGLSDRVRIELGPALETLSALDASGGAPFDFAYVDADKVSYDAYYEACLGLLRPGGLIMLDNVLRDGLVIEPDSDDEGTKAMIALNAKIAADERVDISMLGIADGVTLALKR
jgi:predicted O-methyltransferase YrrM